MSQNIYQSNNFELWNKCKRQYYFRYVKKLTFFDSKEKYKLGRNIHSLIYYKIRGFDTSKIERTLDAKTKVHWNYIKNHPMFKNEAVLAEWSFNTTPDKKHWLVGRIDAVFYDKTNEKYIIADWKTAQKLPGSPEDNFQALMYMYCLLKAKDDLKLPLSCDNLEFHFINTNEKEGSKIIKCTPELIDKAHEQFISLINEINEAENYPQNQGKECCNCAYSGIC